MKIVGLIEKGDPTPQATKEAVKHVCPVCGEEFTSKNKLKTHLKDGHPDAGQSAGSDAGQDDQ